MDEVGRILAIFVYCRGHILQFHVLLFKVCLPCAQALPVAALGCTSLRQLLSEVAAVPEGLGTLLHAAVRSECLSMVSVLLDLGRFG